MPCFSPLKGWKDNESGGICFREGSNTTEKMDVSCGQCLGCRVDRSRSWAMRICHESSLYESNCFITLTYRSPEECTRDQYKNGLYVPEDFSLHKSHFQKFMKRLRRDNPDTKIRYYMCGEYGSVCSHNLDLDVYPHAECKTGRPHYHCCLFNYAPPTGEPLGEGLYSSPYLDKIWKYGYTSVGELSFQSAAYVSRYILKKVNGRNQEEHYTRITDDGEILFLEPEFSSMSLKPGIGKEWYERYKRDVFPSDEVPVPGVGVVKSVPRFYEEQLKKADPVLHQEIKERRQKYLKENPEEFSTARLETKFKVKKANMALFDSLRNKL